MTTEQEKVSELVREMYESAEKTGWGLSPESIRSQRRRHVIVTPDPKAIALVGAAVALIITGFFVFGRPASQKPALVAGPATTTTSTINSKVLANTLACLPHFAAGTSQSDGALVGKSFPVAKALIAASSQTWRIVAQDGTCENVTSDLQSGRVDLWVIEGQVVKAVLEGPHSSTSPTLPEKGVHSVVVPNVIGLDQSQAAEVLGAAGLQLAFIRSVPSTSIAAGKVVIESPVAGSSVASDSSVDLSVSEGR
jgi:serine/threonine-protein kinase